MNKTKTTIIVAMSMAFPLIVNAASEDNGEPKWHHGDRVEHLSQELGLSADQKTKLEAITKEQREKCKALHEEKHKQIEGILTKEQLAKYEELKKQRHEKWKSKHEGAASQVTEQPK